MNLQNPNYGFSGSGSAPNAILPISAFSAYSLLRNCNYLISSQVQDATSKKNQENSSLDLFAANHSPNVPSETFNSSFGSEKSLFNLPTSKSFLTPPQLFAYPPPPALTSHSRTLISPCSLNNASFRRQRGEKKPIPEEQKDDKYFERRRRNNQAAKKSRDARKMREDQIALRATVLEHENAILRAQVLTLREEASSLRQMLLQKKALELAQSDTPICIT